MSLVEVDVGYWSPFFTEGEDYEEATSPIDESLLHLISDNGKTWIVDAQQFDLIN